MPSRPLPALLAAVGALSLTAPAGASDTRAGDYAALTSGLSGQTIPAVGSPGGVAAFGRASFPVLLGAKAPVQAVMAAGRAGGSSAADAARGVAFAHTAFFPSSGGTVRAALFANAVLWAGRRASASDTVVAVVGHRGVASCLSGLGCTVRAIHGPVTDADLRGANVLVLGGHADYSEAVVTRILGFTASGGGLVLSQTPWAASPAALADSWALLAPFGLVTGTDVTPDASFTVGATAPAAIHSALPAAEALLAEKDGIQILTTAEKASAANAVYQTIKSRIDIPGLRTALDALAAPSRYGLIAPTLASPLPIASRPVEKMLLRHQSMTFDALPPSGLFAHPCAADFPGLPDAGAPRVTRAVTVRGDTAADFYMNQGGRPTRFETGLYAPPGEVVTLTLPSALAGQGLQALISANGGEDTTFDYTGSPLTFFPKLWRRVPLTQAVTRTGSVLGGVITILVPAGKRLGAFDVTVAGAVEMPVFRLGQTTDLEWRSGLRTRPAPVGLLDCGKIRHYLPKWQLAALDNPSEVAAYWKRVMDLGDEFFGYAPWRKRGEAVAYSRYVSAGAAYAGYPIEAGWAADSGDEMLNLARLAGSWGEYHELGHGYQDNFDHAFVIANHAEVDVNLLPGLLYTRLHDRTAWDKTHSTFDGASRLEGRDAYLALPASSRTWAQAHSTSPVAYDFYFNLAEAFGWEVYKTAFTRLMNFLQNPVSATDPALFALDASDPNFKRNRFYLLFCEAAGRNLDAYFQSYGLGAPGKGAEITQSVKDAVAAKGYPVWTTNTPIDFVSTPPALTVEETLAPGTVIHEFSAKDADEPGTLWEYQITAGNPENAFSLDKRGGRLRVQQVDAETRSHYVLAVTVSDNGVPRQSVTRTVSVAVRNQPEPPRIEGRLFVANSSLPDGAILGAVSVTVEPGRTLSRLSLVAGGDGLFSLHPTTGELSVRDSSALPVSGVCVLTLRAEDSAGAFSLGKATVLCNSPAGLHEERWHTGRMLGPPDQTSLLATAEAPSNAGDRYVRRVTGWIVPARTGPHRFWVAANHKAIVSLGADGSRASAVAICSVASGSAVRGYDERVNQRSDLIWLEAGRPRFLQIIHRDHAGDDNLSVAWEGPGFARTVVPGANLVPGRPALAMPGEDPAASP